MNQLAIQQKASEAYLDQAKTTKNRCRTS